MSVYHSRKRPDAVAFVCDGCGRVRVLRFRTRRHRVGINRPPRGWRETVVFGDGGASRRAWCRPLCELGAYDHPAVVDGRGLARRAAISRALGVTFDDGNDEEREEDSWNAR